MRDGLTAASLLKEGQEALTRNPAEALRLAARAAALAERREEWAEAAAAWHLRSRALRIQARHREALPTIDRAAECARRAEDPLLAARVQVGRIDSLGMLGRVREAFDFGAGLTALLPLLGADAEAARVRINLGILHYRLDDYASALADYDKAMPVLEARSEDPLSLASLCFNRANALVGLGRAGEATPLLERARVLSVAAGHATLAAAADINQGFLLHASGRHAEALALQGHARAAFEEIGDEEGRAQCDADLAETYRALNLIPESLECAARAARAFADLGMRYDRGRAELGHAAALGAQARHEDADAALERAEIAFAGRRYGVQRAHTRLLRARLRRIQGRAAEAEALARAAERAFSRRRLFGWAAEARFMLAEPHAEAGDPAAGRQMACVARSARRHGRGWLECRAERVLGRYRAARGQRDLALGHFRAAVDALERARTLIAPEDLHVAFLGDKLAVYEDAVTALLTRGRRRDVAEALEMVERSRSRLLLERVQSAVQGRTTQSDAATRLDALRADLSRAYYRDGAEGDGATQRRLGPTPPNASDLERLEKEYRAALRAAELDAGDGASLLLSGVPSVAALASGLRPKEALLEFYTAGENICAFVMTRRGLVAHARLARVGEVAYAARRLRFHMQRAGAAPDYARHYASGLLEEADEALSRLYDLLLRPLASDLPDGEIVLVPHGPLHGLPFHAFRCQGVYALEKWEFLYAPSAALWYAGARRERETRVTDGPSLLLGAPAPGLPRVAEEVKLLAQSQPGAHVLCGDGATVRAFREHAPGASLIHIAAHAEFRADNPLFSGIRLADDWLLARDLYGMRLGCDLATLSACQTGTTRVEPGDELFGLLRGFIAAGAHSVAASLWPVDDGATADLMASFYAHLGRGMTKAAALRAAQWEARALNPHPYYWAAFFLMGERGKGNEEIGCLRRPMSLLCAS